MEGEYELVCDLWNGAIINDLERTLTLFSRSHHSLTLNIPQTATDTAIVTIEGEYETELKLLNGTGFNDLERPLTTFQGHNIIQRQKNSKNGTR